ncbi:hypothetical protein CBX57_013360 [Salmonella enterica]|nr:hypothetical protein [Salmonella enterica]
MGWVIYATEIGELPVYRRESVMSIARGKQKTASSAEDFIGVKKEKM